LVAPFYRDKKLSVSLCVFRAPLQPVKVTFVACDHIISNPTILVDTGAANSRPLMEVAVSVVVAGNVDTSPCTRLPWCGYRWPSPRCGTTPVVSCKDFPVDSADLKTFFAVQLQAKSNNSGKSDG
jgi:hypothetical protein